MIKNFLKNHSIHKNIVKYFDFLFLFNLSYFFILFALFTWGMSAAYYSKGIQEEYYFLLSINIVDFIFFISLFLFLGLMNIKIQIDDLSILDWNSKDDEYKLNLNYLYVSPNFISIKRIKRVF